jgi:hypothetical protein
MNLRRTAPNTKTNTIGSLQRWARKANVLPSCFRCEQYNSCQHSRTEKKLPRLRRGKTVLMSYVGHEYGRPVRGARFALVIVGMSHAGDGGYNYLERQRSGRKWVTERRINRHYRGILWMAAALLGDCGSYCSENCLRAWRCMAEDLPKTGRCALSSIIQPNLAKCAGGDEGTCLTTPVMYKNCSPHLLGELEVLKPTIIVFQAAPARAVIPNAVRERGWQLQPIAASPHYDGPEAFPVVQYLRTPTFGSHVLFLNHPSRGNIERQWKPIIKPSLNLLRKLNAIPT